MKKRFLSLLMAMCLMATLVPAAFAAGDDGGRPIPEDQGVVNEADAAELPEAAAYATYPGSGTQKDPIVVDVYGEEDFQYLVTACKQYTGKYYKVTLKTDLNLSTMGGAAPAEWGAYLHTFMGTFDGGGNTISGIPKNCFLFFQIHNADIGNFKLDLGGVAGSLMYYTFHIKMRDGSIEWGSDRLHDIDVVSGSTIQLVGNDQANYAPFMFAAGPYFTMKNCNNYANISGNTYAGVFSGYYPLPAKDYPSDCYFKFIDCENHGDINLRYAGLFFGNPTGLRADRNITFDGVKNYGEVRGTESAHFFCSDAGSKDYFTGSGYFSEMENDLDPKDDANSPMRQTCTDSNCPSGNVGHSGTLCIGSELTDFSIGIDGNKHFVVTPTSETDKVAYYTVTAYRYVNLFDGDGNSQGTTRVSYTETVNAPTYTTSNRLVDYPLRDGISIDELNVKVEIVKPMLLYYSTDTDKLGYWLNNDAKFNGSEAGKPFFAYIVNPTTAGEAKWSAYASAYDKDNQLIDTVELVRTAE